MNETKSKSSKGFTLVEVLVTVSLFGLLMGVLLSSLSTGAKAWSRADASLVRQAELRHALDTLVRDLEHLYFELELEEPVFVSGIDEGESPVLSVVSLGGERNLDEGLWLITWRLGEDAQGGGTSWIRSARAIKGGVAVGNPVETTMLENVGKIVYGYHAQGQWADEWPDKEKIPQLVRIQASLKGAPATTAWAEAFVSGGKLE